MTRQALAVVLFFSIVGFASGVEDNGAEIVLINESALYSMPDFSSTIKTKLSRNTIGEVVAKGKSDIRGEDECYWYYVKFDDYNGWVFGRDIIVSGSLFGMLFGEWSHYYSFPNVETEVLPTVSFRNDGTVEFFYKIKTGRKIRRAVDSDKKLCDACIDIFFTYEQAKQLHLLKWSYNEVKGIIVIKMPKFAQASGNVKFFEWVRKLKTLSYKQYIDDGLYIECDSLIFKVEKLFKNGVNNKMYKSFSINGASFNKVPTALFEK